MSHQLDFDGVLERLTLLQHFAYGSEQYCRDRLAGSEHDVGDGALDEYWGWVKSIVCSYTLECSIRIRVLLDTVADKPEADKIPGIDSAARSGLVIGRVIDGQFDLTLRETCNKIIHARKVIPMWATGVDGLLKFRYWSGDCELSGKRGSETWRLLLHIAPWARSIERFLVAADAAEVTMYVGQDWY
jgi:hypothetical protein